MDLPLDQRRSQVEDDCGKVDVKARYTYLLFIGFIGLAILFSCPFRKGFFVALPPC